MQTMLETRQQPLAQCVAGIEAGMRLVAAEHAAREGLVSALHALFLTLIAGMLGRLAALIAEWQAGLPAPRQRRPATAPRRTSTPIPPVADRDSCARVPARPRPIPTTLSEPHQAPRPIRPRPIRPRADVPSVAPVPASIRRKAPMPRASRRFFKKPPLAGMHPRAPTVPA